MLEKKSLTKGPNTPKAEFYRIATRATEIKAQRSWENDLTDPANHDPNKFTYAVHALNPKAFNALKVRLLYSEGGYDRSQDIDLWQQPERLADKKVISISVINQDHTATTSDQGFILRVPPNNVIRAYSGQGATPFNSIDSVLADRDTLQQFLRS